MDKEELMTLAQAAEYAGVPRRTLAYAAKQGYLRARRLGPRTWVTTRSAVDEWLHSDKKRSRTKPI